MTVDFTKLPIGTMIETVWGPGEIVSTTYSETYPIRVMPSGSTFTKYGLLLVDHARPSLFLAPFEWPTQEQPEPLFGKRGVR